MVVNLLQVCVFNAVYAVQLLQCPVLLAPAAALSPGGGLPAPTPGTVSGQRGPSEFDTTPTSGCCLILSGGQCSLNHNFSLLCLILISVA